MGKRRIHKNNDLTNDTVSAYKYNVSLPMLMVFAMSCSFFQDTSLRHREQEVYQVS